MGLGMNGAIALSGLKMESTTLFASFSNVLSPFGEPSAGASLKTQVESFEISSG
jgi:hypothetical protein